MTSNTILLADLRWPCGKWCLLFIIFIYVGNFLDSHINQYSTVAQSCIQTHTHTHRGDRRIRASQVWWLGVIIPNRHPVVHQLYYSHRNGSNLTHTTTETSLWCGWRFWFRPLGTATTTYTCFIFTKNSTHWTSAMTTRQSIQWNKLSSNRRMVVIYGAMYRWWPNYDRARHAHEYVLYVCVFDGDVLLMPDNILNIQCYEYGRFGSTIWFRSIACPSKWTSASTMILIPSSMPINVVCTQTYAMHILLGACNMCCVFVCVCFCRQTTTSQHSMTIAFCLPQTKFVFIMCFPYIVTL